MASRMAGHTGGTGAVSFALNHAHFGMNGGNHSHNSHNSHSGGRAPVPEDKIDKVCEFTGATRTAAATALRRSYMDCDEAVMRLLSGAADMDECDDDGDDDAPPPLIPGGHHGGGPLQKRPSLD
jgi:hypothetical protein